jgi:hypothetical protein
MIRAQRAESAATSPTGQLKSRKKRLIPVL